MNGLYERLLNFTQDGVYRYRFEDGVILAANQGLLRILDLEMESRQLIGRSLSSLMHYTEKPGEVRRLLEERGEIHGYEYHFKTLRGDDRWVLHDSFLVSEPETGAKVVEAIVRDITAIKIANMRLEEERERLAVTLHSIGDALIATDAEGKVVLMNPVAESLTGWLLNEADGVPLNEVFHIINERTREPVNNPVERVFQTGCVVGMANHTALISRTGAERSIADSAAPIRNAAGGVIGVVMVFRDVTDEKILWDTLQTREEHYRLLFNGMQNGFALHEIILDDQGKPEDYRFLEVNPRFEEMTGIQASNLIGKRVLEVMPNLEPEWIENYGQVALTGNPIHFERYSSALNKHYEVTAYRPAPGQFVTIVADITERRKAEEERRRMESQLLQVQKMESLGMLAGGIAYDFNNLLTGVLGNASLALLDVPPGVPAHDSLKQIELSAQRAADLCRQLLAYSGKGKFVVEPTDITDVVEEMGQLLQLSISKKAVLKYSLTRHLPAISVDVTQLRQILMNLIVNASEAIGERSGVIAITTGAMECDRNYLKSVFLDVDLSEGIYVYVEVSDTGCGMEAATLARIFDPFFSTKFSGRGLGLAAILGIVRAHKGAIKVYSEPRRGSTFKVLFPTIEDAPVHHAEVGAQQEPIRLTGTILVADDDETVRSLARRTLERAGARVLTASDGREAVDMFARHAREIRLVLLDMTMPHMNGEEVFREIRRIKSDCVVLLSSGYNEFDATDRFAGKGLAGFIQKPYRQSDLIGKINAILK